MDPIWERLATELCEGVNLIPLDEKSQAEKL